MIYSQTKNATKPTTQHSGISYCYVATISKNQIELRYKKVKNSHKCERSLTSNLAIYEITHRQYDEKYKYIDAAYYQNKRYKRNLRESSPRLCTSMIIDYFHIKAVINHSIVGDYNAVNNIVKSYLRKPRLG